MKIKQKRKTRRKKVKSKPKYKRTLGQKRKKSSNTTKKRRPIKRFTRKKRGGMDRPRRLLTPPRRRRGERMPENQQRVEGHIESWESQESSPAESVPNSPNVVTYSSNTETQNQTSDLNIPPQTTIQERRNLNIPPVILDGRFNYDFQEEFLNQANETITSLLNSIGNNPDWRRGVDELSQDDLKKIDSFPDGMGIDGINILSMNPIYETNKRRFQSALSRREVEELYQKLEIIVEAYFSTNYNFSSERTYNSAVQSTLSPIKHMRVTRQSEINNL